MMTKKTFPCIYLVPFYLCDFVVRDIEITVYLQSPRKINFNLVSDFPSKWKFSKIGILTINKKVVIDLFRSLTKSL